MVRSNNKNSKASKKMITFDENKQVFHLKNEQISYLIQIEEEGYLAHLYYGQALSDYSGHYQFLRSNRSFSPNPAGATARSYSIDTLMLEYPGYGYGDFREPAFNLKLANGSRVTDFRYDRYLAKQGIYFMLRQASFKNSTGCESLKNFSAPRSAPNPASVTVTSQLFIAISLEIRLQQPCAIFANGPR